MILGWRWNVVYRSELVGGKNEIFTIKKISKELKKRRERESGEREGKTNFFLKERNNNVIIDGWPGGRVVGSYIGTITNITKDSPLP